MNVLDLFSGCGGFSMGFHRAGFNIVAANDIWKPAADTYKHNFPDVEFIFGDITDKNIKRKIFNFFHSKERMCDIIVGGPPCQVYSISGKRNPKDPRGHLFNDYVGIVKKLSPKVFILENVPGVLSMIHSGGYVVDRIIASFRQIGYYVKCKILDSADYSSPQHRKRVIFIGTRDDIYIPFPKPLYGPGLIPFKTVRETIDDLSELPENKQLSHIFANHSKSFITKITNTPVGKGVGAYSESFFRADPDLPCNTVKANNGSVFLHYKKNRSMSPRELARLQGFPDSFIFLGSKHDVFILIGNSVPCELSYAIAKSVKTSLEGL